MCTCIHSTGALSLTVHSPPSVIPFHSSECKDTGILTDREIHAGVYWWFAIKDPTSLNDHAPVLTALDNTSLGEGAPIRKESDDAAQVSGPFKSSDKV